MWPLSGYTGGVSLPFFENPDNTHCFQAVLRMTLKHYLPDQDFTWRELEEITAKVQGLWTWPMTGELWLHDQGFELKIAEPFDYQKFVKEGPAYLVELFGEEVGNEQIKHSNIAQEIQYAKRLIEKGLTENRIPTIPEIMRLLDEGYLIICNVNSRRLNNKGGYAGHFVLLTSYENEGLILHDPGPPGYADRRVSTADFEQAWTDPNERAKNYIAMKLK
jgi:hypothetical protein